MWSTKNTFESNNIENLRICSCCGPLYRKFIKKSLWYRCISVNLTKLFKTFNSLEFFKNPFFINFTRGFTFIEILTWMRTYKHLMQHTKLMKNVRKLLNKCHAIGIHLVAVMIVHSALWKFSLHIVYVFKKAWNFLIRFWCCDQMFSRNIFALLCVKSEKSAHMQLAITLFYMLMANIMILYQLET